MGSVLRDRGGSVTWWTVAPARTSAEAWATEISSASLVGTWSAVDAARGSTPVAARAVDEVAVVDGGAGAGALPQRAPRGREQGRRGLVGSARPGQRGPEGVDVVASQRREVTGLVLGWAEAAPHRPHAGEQREQQAGERPPPAHRDRRQARRLAEAVDALGEVDGVAGAHDLQRERRVVGPGQGGVVEHGRVGDDHQPTRRTAPVGGHRRHRRQHVTGPGPQHGEQVGRILEVPVPGAHDAPQAHGLRARRQHAGHR